jgi:hypothetical protein
LHENCPHIANPFFIAGSSSPSSSTASVGSGQIPSTRPCFSGGPFVISSGCDGLDKLFGGGIPLGTITVFSQDEGWANHDEIFLKYFVSEGVATGQSVGVIKPSVWEDGLVERGNHGTDMAQRNGVGDFLLRRMSKNEAMKEAAAEKAAEAAAQAETKLRIAWQYEKYAKRSGKADQHRSRPALGKNTLLSRSKSTWCHDYDIVKPPTTEERQQALEAASSTGHIQTYTIDRRGDGVVSQVVRAVRAFTSEISAATYVDRPGSVGRLVLPSLGNIEWTLPEMMGDLLWRTGSSIC